MRFEEFTLCFGLLKKFISLDLFLRDFNARQQQQQRFLMEHDKTYFLDTVRLKSCYASEKDSNLKQGESISFYCMSIPSSLRIDIGMQPPLLIISHDIIALMDRQSKAIQAF